MSPTDKPPTQQTPDDPAATQEQTRPQPESAETELPSKEEGLGFPVVGIGASAGGLEAMTELLNQLPQDIGMAFVLIQHLAPKHDSMMPELLTRETALEVSEITDGIKVQPDHLYVIPPNTNVGIINNALHLMPRDADFKKRHLPIDYFFQSLAKDQGSNAIGIILSGSASDGTLGLKIVKAEGGMTFAQDRASARYDSMPGSAIAAGCVDFVLEPAGIARELAHIARHPEVLRADIADDPVEQGRISGELEKIFMLLRNHSGNDFTYYKQNTIRRRIGRRMLVHKIERLKDYVRYLDSHPDEVDALFHDILINVTGFFRNPEAYEALKQTVFAPIVQDHDNARPVRIWIPGCSSGEETYSVVIALQEYLGDKKAGTSVQVFATDIDEDAITKARTGVYPESITTHVSPERLRRFFTKVPQGYQISKHIRDLCVFAPQNVIKDPPFTHQDLIVCRNLLIYMGSVLQRKVLGILHYALDPGGFLFLGNSESVGASADLFYLVDKAHKIYRRKEISHRTRDEAVRTAVPLSSKSKRAEMLPARAKDQPPDDLQRLAETVILNQYGPPGVIVNEQLDSLLFIGRLGGYLEPASGTASLNLIKLVHPNLAVELRVATHTAFRDKAPIRKEGARLQRDDRIEEISIEVLPLDERDSREPHYLVLFHKVAEHELEESASKPQKAGAKESPDARNDAKDERIRELEKELQSTKTYMQTIIEDQEASNEELQSANEEIQSTNEELQSTNEELETTKEELQSTNEELITVNEELENRNTELTALNNDFVNLINNADLPLIVISDTFRVRYFSPQAHRLLNLIDSDIGRPLNDIRPNIEVGDLTAQVNQVLDTLKPSFTEVQDDQGRWYSMRIRPYRTEDNRISGAVIAFVDITEFRENLARVRRLATVVEDSNDAITVQDFDGRIQAWNPKAAELFGYTEEEALKATIDIIVPPECREEIMNKINIIQEGKNIDPFETLRLHKNRHKLKVLVTMSVLNDETGKPTALATTERLLADQ